MNLDELIKHYYDPRALNKNTGIYDATDPYYTENPSKVKISGLNMCLGVFIINGTNLIALHVVTGPVLGQFRQKKLEGVELLMTSLGWNTGNTRLLFTRRYKELNNNMIVEQDQTIFDICQSLNFNTYLTGILEDGEVTGEEALAF